MFELLPISANFSEWTSGNRTPETRNIQDEVVESVVKNTEAVITIQRDAHVMKEPRENQFYVYVPIGINGENFIIPLNGNLILIKGDSHVIERRSHPFNISGLSGNINFLRTVTRQDIKSGMWFTLMKDKRIISTSPQFFDKLRKRIPSNHPLSTLPIKY